MQLGQFMITKPKIWLGSYVANSMPVTPGANEHAVLPIGLIDRCAARGYETVMDWSYLDVWQFQENIGAVERLISLEALVLELPKTPDELAKEDRFWHSYVQKTSATDSFERMVAQLESGDRIKKLLELAKDENGEIPIWEAGKEFEEEPVFLDLSDELGLLAEPTTAEIIQTARTYGRLDVFNLYDEARNLWLAKAHKCNFMFDPDGKLRRITI